MRRFLLVAASLLWTGRAAAQSPAPPAPVPAATSLTGTWEGAMPHEGSTWHLAVTLTQADTVLTGTIYKDGEEYGPVHGAVHGAAWHFTFDVIGFEGTADGERLQAVMTAYNGTRYPFTLQRRHGGS